MRGGAARSRRNVSVPLRILMLLHTLINKHTLVAATARLLSFALPLMCATLPKPAADLIHPHPRATDHVASALSHVCEAMCAELHVCV